MVDKDLGQNYLEYFYEFPVQNGFLMFTLGALFILTLFHFLLYFQQKDKLYLLYSGYTFFILLSQLGHLRDGFLNRLFLPVVNLMAYPMVYTEVYYCLYVIFAFKFLNLRETLPIWHKHCLRVLYIIIAYCTVLLVIHFLTGSFTILLDGYYGFTIMMSLLGLVIYVPFFKIRNPLKYYMIFGSFCLFSFSVVSLLIYINLGQKGLSQEPSYSVLYVGFLLENILFSLGLGHKQKLILEERNSSQEKLIRQLRENENLREKVQQKLKQEVETMSLEAEAERLKSLKVNFEKELAELKLLALRSQMNPHFIFNSMNSIKRYLIDNDKEKAVYYMNKFSKLIRRILSSSMEKESSLADELETMQLYVNIENIRFNDQLNFEIEVAQDVSPDRIKIPSLLLQPFLENAIWHGLSPKKVGMRLMINVHKAMNGFLHIVIRDNGIGRSRSRELKKRRMHNRPSIGINLSKERLMHFCQKFIQKGKITIEDGVSEQGSPEGTTVIIELPLK